jgi:hypothetical protein
MVAKAAWRILGGVFVVGMLFSFMFLVEFLSNDVPGIINRRRQARRDRLERALGPQMAVSFLVAVSHR